MKKRFKMFCMLFLIGIGVSFAQTRIVGSVADEKGEPLIGASIQVKGTNVGTITDGDGNFALDVKANALLTVSYVGYQSKEVRAVNGMRVILSELQSELGEVVVVGYGTQRKENLTGAVSTVDVGKTMTAKPFSDIAKGLQGNVPGLTITYGSGGIAATPNINIRGLISLNGTNKPLILVDNIVVPDISLISPDDVESISVLKDAASTSIFGARAAGGVILIKTKSGSKSTKFKTTYSNNFSWGNPTQLPDFPKDPVAEINMEVNAFARQGSGFDMFGMQAPDLIAGIQNWQAKYANNRKSNEMVLGEDFELKNGVAYFYRIWDPKEIMYQTMPQQNHNIQFSGGGDKISYFLSGTYSNQEGILKINPDKLTKYNLTAGINADVTNWLNLDAKLTTREYDYNYPYSYQDYFYYMWRWGAYFPYGTYTDPNSGVDYYFRNVNGYIANASTAKYKQNTQNTNLAATIKFSKQLRLRTEFSYLTVNALRHEMGGLISLWDYWAGGLSLNKTLPSASYDETDYTSSFTTQLTSNSYLTYENKFGNHGLKAVVGLNAEKGEFTQQFSKGYGLMDKNMAELPLVTNSQPPVITSTSATYAPDHTWWSVAGYFGRINYDYAGKYLVELDGRYDGSSNFPINARWAFFPSGSLGWRVTEESFAKSLKNVFSDWKIRASYGTIGNQDVGSNLFRGVMSTAQNSWIIGTAKATYTGMPRVVPSSLTWEKINTLDFGTDMRFLNNDLGLTFDWFRRDNNGTISSSTTLPAVFGTSAAKTNVGNLRTNGWELAVDYHHRFDKVNFYATVSLHDYVTKVVKWGGNDALSLSTGYYSGQTIGEIWGFETDRYFTKDDFHTETINGKDVLVLNKGIATQKGLQSGSFTFGPGDIKYKDLNNDSIINGGDLTLAKHGDLKKIGNSTPRYQFSLRFGGDYKGFDLDVYLQGVGKRDYWAVGSLAIPGYSGSSIFYDHQMDFWTPDNPNAKYPNPYQGNSSSTLSGQANWGSSDGVSGNNFYPQTKYLLNLAYLRVKTLTIGYSLPDALLKKLYLSKLRVYVEGLNLFTFANSKIPIDPEITSVSSTGSWYGATTPFSKTYSFGLQLSF